KPTIATHILGGLGVLPAIDFNHQPGLVTKKVSHIGPDGNLTPEFRPGKTAVTERVPELAFGIGQTRAEDASAVRGRHEGPLTRLAPAALGTLSRKGRGFRSAWPPHCLTQVVPSLESFSTIP